MRQFLIDLLKGLESAVAPASGCHHAITYAQYGSDETGWDDKLAVWINGKGGEQPRCFFIEPDDESKSADEIIREIAAQVI